MPNKNSHALHIPLRSCVVCKKKVDRNQLYNFFMLNREVVIDLNRSIPTRKYYVCLDYSCLNSLQNWVAKVTKKNKIKQVCDEQ